MKKIIGFEMEEKMIAEMDALAVRMGVSERKDVFNHAMSLLEFFLLAQEQGHEIILRKDDKDSKDISDLLSPVEQI